MYIYTHTLIPCISIYGLVVVDGLLQRTRLRLNLRRGRDGGASSSFQKVVLVCALDFWGTK